MFENKRTRNLGRRLGADSMRTMFRHVIRRKRRRGEGLYIETKCKLFQQAISPQVNFSRIFQLTHEQKEKGEQSAEQDSPDEVVGPYIAKAEMVARTGEVRRDVGYENLRRLSAFFQGNQCFGV